jgi:hypothetical protein
MNKKNRFADQQNAGPWCGDARADHNFSELWKTVERKGSPITPF